MRPCGSIYGMITVAGHPEELVRPRQGHSRLLHRDMGPVSRYLGPWIPGQEQLQDPVPAVDPPVDDVDVAALKATILTSGLSVSQLGEDGLGFGRFRGTDKRGGANGARIRRQRGWAVNDGRARQGARC